MDVSRPFATVSPGVDGDVLVALAGSTMPWSGRELARRAGRSYTGVQHALDRLVRHGVVIRVEAGHTHLYTLNREHLLAPVVEQMAEARTDLLRRLRGAIASWAVQPAHASLFGSAARGDGDEDSDIDFFIVRPEEADADDPRWRDQIDQLADAVLAWTGNNAGISEVGEGALPRLTGDRPSVAGDLQRDAIDLAGEPTKVLLGRL